MDNELAAEVWARLMSGRTLDGLGLPSHEGRTDLRGLVAPAPSKVSKYAAGGSVVSVLGDVTSIQKGKWSRLDLSGSNLEELRFRDAVIDDCVFDRSKCRGWRLWNTRVSATSFRKADLRGSSLGSGDWGTRNLFSGVDFSQADLRGTSYLSVEVRGCRFARMNASGVDFGGALFSECVFEGPVRDVTFRKFALGRESAGDPPNEMLNVSFRKAHLAWVDFHAMDMREVEWPDDGEHFLIRPYREELERLALAWEAASSELSRRLAVLCRTYLATVAPGRRAGVVSRAELREVGGEEAVAEFQRKLLSP